MKHVPYHEIIKEKRHKKLYISYNELSASAPPGAHLQKLKLTTRDIVQLVTPYIKSRAFDQMKAVIPLAIYLVMYQFLVLGQPIMNASLIAVGLSAVIIGLMFFMEGLRLGLMPLGEEIGHKLPKKSTLPIVLLIIFILGIGVTFAEPAIGALKIAGAKVNVEQAPILYALLNDWSGALVLVVGGGVGIAAVIGTLRFIYDWSLKPIIYLSLIPTLAISTITAFNEDLVSVIGLAWDCGAVTTGPVTVPLVLALGIGIAAAAGTGKSSLSGFGIVTLASIFPILAVELLALYIYATTPNSDIIASATAVASTYTTAPWYEQSPYTEVIGGIRAIVPLVLFLGFVLIFIIRDKIKQANILLLGIAFAIIGMVIFNLGLTYGLALLGNQAGIMLPGAFAELSYMPDTPIYWFSLGITVVLVFAFILGFGATLAEPALNALGATVESLTNGVFRKQNLMIAVSIGVGLGILIGVAKIIFDWSLIWLLLPSYAIALFLTVISSESYVNVAWDSAGVTTGPITVPLVLALGVGLGDAVNASDGFGILAMASVGPIICVMLAGLWISYKKAKLHKQEQLALATDV